MVTSRNIETAFLTIIVSNGAFIYVCMGNEIFNILIWQSSNDLSQTLNYSWFYLLICDVYRVLKIGQDLSLRLDFSAEVTLGVVLLQIFAMTGLKLLRWCIILHVTSEFDTTKQLYFYIATCTRHRITVQHESCFACTRKPSGCSNTTMVTKSLRC